MIAWLLQRWRFGPCSGCRQRVCPNVGPWWARRRVAAYCERCLDSDMFSDLSRQRRKP